MARIHNFSAGPGVLPLDVLRQTQEDLIELNGSGIGLLECSHRSALYGAVIDSARARLHRLLQLDEDQEVLFLQGGAQSQFFMVPMNFLRGGRASYVDTGRWSDLAIGEAKRFGAVDVVYSSREQACDHVPQAGELAASSAESVYLHYTSNNTIAGTQFHHIPENPHGFLVCDASSDILSRPWDGSRYGLIYAGAQKNMGPSGVTVVVIRKSLLERADPDLPTMLRYGVHVAKQSMNNTPNTFGIYIIDQVCKWIEENGGLTAMEARNRAQAERLYSAIDASDFYQGKARKDSRSWMNVSFTTGHEDLDTRFWQSAAQAGLSGLKGHRIVGGLRASIYNAQTNDAVEALVSYMAEFERTHG
jgi:phosphoserine aminotransferase